MLRTVTHFILIYMYIYIYGVQVAERGFLGGQGVAAGSAPSDNEDCQSARGTRANRRTPASQPCTGSQAAVPSVRTVRCGHVAYLHFLILVSHFRLGKYFSFPKFFPHFPRMSFSFPECRLFSQIFPDFPSFPKFSQILT